MHQNRICHRDLKPENFLFTTQEALEKCQLKLIDFGLSRRFEAGEDFTTQAGTPYYVAPQVLQGKYNEASDVWSCGVIMFVLLCGYPPFYGDTDTEVLRKVKTGAYTFASSDWSSVSEDAKALIRRMLKMNHKDRITAEQVLDDLWIREKAPKATGKAIGDGELFVRNLRGFREGHKLKKAALHIIANQLDDSKIKAMRDVFTAMDRNQDGQLTPAEVRQGLTHAGVTDIPPDLEHIMREVDADGSGVIDYSEFLTATVDVKDYLQEENVWAAFRVFDLNGDGKISQDELKLVLKDAAIREEFGDVMKEVDTDGDGFIDFDEFMAMMRSQARKS